MPLPWTPEDDYAARHCATLAQGARITGRSVEAVRARRLRLGAPLSTLKRGAPKKPAEARLSEDFRVFVTPGELRAIDEARGGSTRSEWARRRLVAG
jgi:hypothetical protein